MATNGKSNLEKAREYQEPASSPYAGASQRRDQAYTNAIQGTSVQKYYDSVREQSQNTGGGQGGSSKKKKKDDTLGNINAYLNGSEQDLETTNKFLEEATAGVANAKNEKEKKEYQTLEYALTQLQKDQQKAEKKANSPVRKMAKAVTDIGNKADPEGNTGFITDPVTAENFKQANARAELEKAGPATPTDRKLAREEKRNQEDVRKAKEGEQNFLERAWNAVTSAGDNADPNAGYITDPVAEALAKQEKPEAESEPAPAQAPASANGRRLAREEARNQADTAAVQDSQIDNLLQQYKQAVTQDQEAQGYVTDPNDPEYAQIKQRREDLKNQIIEANRAAGRDLYEGLADEDRLADAVSSWAGGRTAGSVAGAGALLGGVDANVGFIDDTHRDLVLRQAQAAYAGDYALAEELQNQVKQYEADHAGENRTVLGDVSDMLLGNAQDLQAESDRQWQNVTEDMSEGGKFAANVAKTGADVVADMIDNAIVPGSGTIRMYMGAGGGGALEQLARENNDPDAVAIAALTRGASAWLSTKLVGGMESVYGKSILGEGIDKLIGNASPATQTILKPLLNTEGLEEGLEDVLNYCADYILKLSPEEQMDWDEAKQDALVGYILGVITNGLSGGVNYDAKKRAALAQEAIEFVQSGMDIDEAAQAALDNTRDTVVMKPGSTGEEVRKNREEARAQADAANVQQDQEAAAKVDQTVEEIQQEQERTPEQETVLDILRNPSGADGKLSNSQVKAITSDQALMQAFEEVTGQAIAGTTNSEIRNSAKDAASAFLLGEETQEAAREQARERDEIDSIIDEVRGWDEGNTEEESNEAPDAVVNNLLGNEAETSGEPSERTQEQRLSREEARNEADTEKVQNDQQNAETASEQQESPENPSQRTERDIIDILSDPGLANAFQDLDSEETNAPDQNSGTASNANTKSRATQLQLLNVYVSNIINQARNAGIDLKPFYQATQNVNVYSASQDDVSSLVKALGPIVSELDAKGDAQAFNYLNAIMHMDIPPETAGSPEAPETPTGAQEASGNINTQEEQGNAPEGELNTQEASGEQTAPETETNPESKPAKQKTGKKTVTNNGKPDANTESAFDALVAKNGSIEKGENPARDINVPTKDTNSKKVGEGVRTIFEAAATPEERIASLKAAVVNGDFGHVTVNNDARSKEAAAKIAKDGWSRSVSDFLASVEAGKTGPETIALGAHLLNEAGNSPEASGRDYIELAMAYNEATRNTAQGLVAARILKTLTPEGKLYGFEKTVEKINQEIKKNNEKKSGKKQNPEVKLDEKLVEDYLNAKTEEERNKTWDKMAKNVADQTPNTLRDKFTALRYLNMLGNFKTQARNVMGNVGMTAVQKVKNEVVSALEGIASKASGGEYERMYKGFYGTDLHKAALEDFGSDKDLQKVAKGEAKYSDVGKQAMEAIQDKKDPFSNKNPVGKFLNLYSKATNAAMEYGDLIFVRANYADALAGYMNAHKISAADWKAMVADPSKAAEVDKARQYAIKQAQEATFRDTNAVSKFMSTVDSRWPKPAKAVAQGILPFRKTPANVMVRMEEYSPIGFANAVVKAAQTKNGNASVSDVVDSAAKALTGTGLAWLGFALRSSGLLRTKDKDDKEEKIAKLKGQQDYAIEYDTPDGKHVSYTLDWLTPASASIFMGSELFDLVEDGGLTLADAGTVLTTLTNPMMETSMLSGVNDALDNLSDFEGDNSALAQMVMNSMWSYLTQGTSNTLLGQMEQFSEKYRQTYYTDKDNPLLGPSAQKKLAKLGNKTPGFDYQNADYIDAWGRKQENDENLLTRAFNTFINPGYVSDMDKKEEKANDVVDMLYKFGKKQTYQDDFPNVVPQTPSRNTTVNGTKLTPEEYEVYATTAGQAKLDAVNEFTESDLYKEMDNFSRAETISDIYSYSSFLAASKIAKQRGEDYWDDTFSPLITGEKEDGENAYKAPIKEDDIPEYLAFKNEYDSAMKAGDYDTIDFLLDDAKNLPASARKGVVDRADNMGTLQDLRNAGLSSTEVYYQFKDGMKSIYESEKRTATRSSDYIREAGSGKYSNKDADAIMNYEKKVSEQTIARYQDQVRYNLGKAGMTNSYNQVWNMVQQVGKGEMTKDQFKGWVEKNVPIQYQKAIRDVASNYAEDRHVAGKTVSGIYRAARAVGSTPKEALDFYNMIDTNYNGSYTKKELDAACKRMYGNTDTAKRVRAELKSVIGY